MVADGNAEVEGKHEPVGDFLSPLGTHKRLRWPAICNLDATAGALGAMEPWGRDVRLVRPVECGIPSAWLSGLVAVGVTTTRSPSLPWPWPSSTISRRTICVDFQTNLRLEMMRAQVRSARGKLPASTRTAPVSMARGAWRLWRSILAFGWLFLNPRLSRCLKLDRKTIKNGFV